MTTRTIKLDSFIWVAENGSALAEHELERMGDE